MQIIDEEVKKTLAIFNILELPQEEAEKHVKKLQDALLLDMAAEAYAEKGHMFSDVDFTQDGVEDFLMDNYDEKEIEEVLARVSRDTIVEYFSKILKDVPEEKMEKINEILESKFE
jgi:hypothetical protein